MDRGLYTPSVQLANIRFFPYSAPTELLSNRDFSNKKHVFYKHCSPYGTKSFSYSEHPTTKLTPMVRLGNRTYRLENRKNPVNFGIRCKVATGESTPYARPAFGESLLQRCVIIPRLT